MRRIGGKEPMESVGMTRDHTDCAESFQLILNTTESETAIPHYLPNISRPPFATEQQPKDFRTRARKQNV